MAVAVTAVVISSNSVGQSHQVDSSTHPPKQGDSEPKGHKQRINEPVKWRGRYTNVDYGFSVKIPAGFVGEGSVAPAPNHGFAIHLGERSVVWVDATYENSPDSPHEFGSFNAKLGVLQAERKSWGDNESGINLLHCSVVARGFDRSTPIIYTIQVDTTAAHREEAMWVFEAVVNSFRQVPVRP